MEIFSEEFVCRNPNLQELDLKRSGSATHFLQEVEDSINATATATLSSSSDSDSEDEEAETTLSPSSPTALTPPPPPHASVKLRPTSISPGASRPGTPTARSPSLHLSPRRGEGGSEKSYSSSPCPSPSMDRPSPDGSSNSGSPVPAKSPCLPHRSLTDPCGAVVSSVPGTPTLPTAPPSSLESTAAPPLPPKAAAAAATAAEQPAVAAAPTHVSVIVLGQDSYQVCIPVLRIHAILMWILIRIWIRRSMPLTNGFWSGPCYFHHWPRRCQQKLIFFKSFSA